MSKIMNALKNPIVLFISIALLTVFTHWSLVQLYATFCAPWGLWGPFKLFITLGSPTCHFINIVQVELAKHYITIWVSAAAASIAWIATKVV
tara:strand:- start:1853 stop:2128 length:276 start_codon:yes stop_codon:yes gene_type:complete